MSRINSKITSKGIVLPEPLQIPAGVTLLFPDVNIRGNSVFVSGHGALEPDGSLSGPFGQVGSGVSVEDAVILAQKTAFAILASLKREVKNLDRITGWNRVFGMVSSAPGFDRQPEVINGFSEVILDLFGPTVGRHARSAVGVAALPFGIAVEIEAELTITRERM